MDGDLKKKKSKEAMVVNLDAQAQPSGVGNGEDTRKKKPVKKTKLKQEVIDLILKEPFEPLGDDDDDEVLGMSEPYRACHAKTRAALQALAEFDADIIKQYQAKGYAEVDMLVTDSDDKS